MIRIGPAGFGGEAIEGLQRIKQAGLDAAEVEFTYGVRMLNDKAKEIGLLAKKLGISLSVHAPYYINLASEDKTKITASKKRILDSCERAHFLGAGAKAAVVFHAAYYGKIPHENCYELVKEAIVEMQKTISKNKWNSVLAPETTGKKSQFGTVDELLKLSKETGCWLCVDFAHLLARNNHIEYKALFEKLKHSAPKHIPCHFSGIEWTDAGERRHLLTKEQDIKELLSWVKKYNLDMNIINESPDPLGDSIKTAKILKSIK